MPFCGFWLEEIIAIREIFFQHLSVPQFPEGQSKGILYKVKKEKKTYGYLFGTFHYAVTQEMQEATELSPAIYKKLCKCIVIGTEVKIPPKGLGYGSVEKQLIAVAKQQAIVNFGIDTPERNKMGEMIQKESEEKMSEEKKHSILQFVSRITQAYREGNRKVLAENPPGEINPEEVVLNDLRNKVMAQNIDAILTASTKVTNAALQPKSFFSIGCAHLLAEGSIPERLNQMGGMSLLSNNDY